MPALVRGVSGRTPRFGERVYLAETAVVVGDVELGDDVNVWFGAVLRGDVGFIKIGRRSNVQDLCMLHMSRDLSNTVIGDDEKTVREHYARWVPERQARLTKILKDAFLEQAKPI